MLIKTRILALLICLASFSWGQFLNTGISGTQSNLVKQIRVEGNRQVSRLALLEKLSFVEGQNYSPTILQRKVRESIRELHRSGVYEDIQVEVEYIGQEGDLILIFKIKERPTLAKVEIIGNDELGNQELQDILMMINGQILSAADIERGRQKLRQKYREDGFWLAEISYSTQVDAETGGTILSYNIREGRKVNVAGVKLHGNKNLSEKDVEGALGSEISAWYNDGFFLQDVFEGDGDSVEQVYRTNGFLDADVKEQYFTFRVDSSFHFYVGFLTDENRKLDSILNVINKQRRISGTILNRMVMAQEQTTQPWRVLNGQTQVAVKIADLHSEESLTSFLNKIIDIGSMREEFIKAMRNERKWHDSDLRNLLKSESLSEASEKQLVRLMMEELYPLPKYKEMQAGNEVDLHFRVEEGRKFYAGRFRFVDNNVHSDMTLGSRMELKPGEVFDFGKYQMSMAALYGLYREEGYLFSRIEEKKEYRDSVVDVNFVFTEGKPARVRRVDIEGNTLTKDKVIRRNIRLFPGDTYRQSLMERSFREIMQTNYFDNVVPDLRPRNEEEVDLLFKVQEREAGTGQFTAGMAYSAKDKLTGTLGLSIPNCCLGDGQQANLTVEYGGYRKNVVVGFAEPWFLDRPIRLGGQLSYYHYDYDDSDYQDDIERFGGRIYSGTRLPIPDDYSYGQVDYELMMHRQGDNPHDDAVVRYTGLESSVSLSFIRDDKNLPVFPTDGSRFSLKWQYAGLGGDFDFMKTELNTKWWFPVIKDMALHFDGQLGIISGDAVQNSTLYQMGGMLGYEGRLRGYAPGSIGRYRLGRSYMSISTELQYALAPNQFYLLGFFNAGNVYGKFLDRNNLPSADEIPKPWEEIDVNNLYRDVGFGFRVIVPMLGIIGFDWGWPLDPKELSNGEQHDRVGDYQVNFIISQGF